VSDGSYSIVSGPRASASREDAKTVDLDPAAFPYMGARQGHVAGVDGCYVLRLGFTGGADLRVAHAG
jgi:glycine cleavage system aminomethyltransferase T